MSTMIFLVCGSDYEWHATMGAFSKKEDAEAFRVELAANGSENYFVEEHEIDAPRDRRQGAWVVRVNPEGKVDADWEPWWDNSGTPSDEGWVTEHGALAHGATIAAATRKARRALKSARSIPEVSPHD